MLTLSANESQRLPAPSSFRSFGARAFVVGGLGSSANGRGQPGRIAINRSPKQRTAPEIVTAVVAGSRNALPITTTAAPARAATAERSARHTVGISATN